MDLIPLNITNPFNNAPVYFRDRTDSTMSDAAQLCDKGVASGTVVAAGYQSAGRGRFEDRKWISDTGESLLLTLILDPDGLVYPKELVPLLAGLGVAHFINSVSGRRCEIKWPNDVLVEGCKISGILCESKAEHVLVGVGINCKQQDNISNGKLPLTSLSIIDVDNCEPLDLLDEALRHIHIALSLDDAIERIEAMLYLADKQVSVNTGLPEQERVITGRLAGIGQRGQLLLGTADGEAEVWSGEIVLT